MERLLGNIDAKLDVKGRVFVPSVFRKILQAREITRLIMRKDIYQDCLVLYPDVAWNEKLDQLRASLDPWNAEQQQIYRMFVLDLEVVEIDASGRILLPKRYTGRVGIGTDLRFIGMGDTIEVWSVDKLEEASMPIEQFREGIKKWVIPTITR